MPGQDFRPGKILLVPNVFVRGQEQVVAELAIVVLGNQQWPDVRLHLERIVAAINAAAPGSYSVVEIPRRD